MTAQLWVPGPLPGMNEMIRAAKSGRGRRNAYARMKSTWSGIVAAQARHLPAFPGRVSLQFRWLERDKRRDPDNVAAARKFILDGLVAAGVLRGDGWRFVDYWHDSFAVFTSVPLAIGPGVEVTIREPESTVLMDQPGTSVPVTQRVK